MATDIIYSDTSDGYILSQATTWAKARDGATADIAFSASTTDTYGLFVAAGYAGDYVVGESFFSFDTSGIGTDAVSSVVLSIRATTYNTAATGTFRARLHDWGASLTTADWVAGVDLGGKPLLAHIGVASWVLDAYNDFTNDAFPAYVNKTGATRIVVHEARAESSTAPTGATYNDSTVYFSDFGGSTQDPKITVVHAPPYASARVPLWRRLAMADRRPM